jgi:hypothetical protein
MTSPCTVPSQEGAAGGPGPAHAAPTNAAGQDDRELPGSADAIRRSQLSPVPAAPDEAADRIEELERELAYSQGLIGAANNALSHQASLLSAKDRELTQALDRERLATMRADQAEEARDAAQRGAEER